MGLRNYSNSGNVDENSEERIKELDALLENFSEDSKSSNGQEKSYEDLVNIDNLFDECEEKYGGDKLESRKKYYFKLQFGV